MPSLEQCRAVGMDTEVRRAKLQGAGVALWPHCPPERGMAEGAKGPLGGRGLTSSAGSPSLAFWA